MMIPVCARKARLCWPFRHQLPYPGINQILPTLLDSWGRFRDEDNQKKTRDEDEKKMQTKRVLLNTALNHRNRFPVATDLRDLNRFTDAKREAGLRDLNRFTAKHAKREADLNRFTDVKHAKRLGDVKHAKREAVKHAKHLGGFTYAKHAKREAGSVYCLSRPSRWMATDSEGTTQEKKRKDTRSLEELPIPSDDSPNNVPIWQRIAAVCRRIASAIIYAIKTGASMNRQQWAAQLKKWKTVLKRELKHYWVGLKLLWVEIRISTRLLVNLSAGKGLTRREQHQLRRTASDIVRLVPFIIIVIVPFMEFLLPVLLKIFPTMLPSTFQDHHKKESELTKRLEARLNHAKLLQKTVVEMVDEVKQKHKEKKDTSQDLDAFMTKVRSGQNIENSEILGFAKLFNDELTLDNISRPRLVSMCKYMGLKPYGTDAYLRYSLRKKLAWIKSDDALIKAEGVNTLSDAELRSACRERGMLVSLSQDQLRRQLNNWLQLSLEHSVPSSLLILSRAFVPHKMKPAEAVQATLLSLPDEVVDSVGVTVLPSDDTLEDRQRKLEVLEQQEAMIKREKEQREQRQREKEQQKQMPGGNK